MAKVMFVDDRLDEVTRQWCSSGCANDHELMPLEPFTSIERTCQLVQSFEPDVVLIGYGLGHATTTGADVIHALRTEGYNGCIVANSGGDMKQFERSGQIPDGSANRTPHGLWKAVHQLTKEQEAS